MHSRFGDIRLTNICIRDAIQCLIFNYRLESVDRETRQRRDGENEGAFRVAGIIR